MRQTVFLLARSNEHEKPHVLYGGWAEGLTEVFLRAITDAKGGQKWECSTG